jgi:hypothetical protein
MGSSASTVGGAIANPPRDAGVTSSASAAGDAVAQAAPSASPPAMTRAQLEAVEAARRRGRKITFAAGVATFSGCTLATFALLTLIGGVFSLPAAVLGVGLCVVAYVELRGARRMRAFDPIGPRMLGFNQLALGAMLVIYAIWSLIGAVTGPGRYDAYTSGGGQMAEMLEPIERLETVVAILFYAAVIAFAVVVQGCTAVYYFTRAGHIRAFRERTPPWIRDMLRIAAG